MSIRTRCPECGKEYELPDRRLGDDYECQKCGEEFVVRRAGARSRDDDGDRPRRRRAGRDEGGGKTVLLVTGGVFAALALAAGLYFAFRKPSKPADSSPEVALNPTDGPAPKDNPVLNPPGRKDPVVNPPKKDPVVAPPKKEPPPEPPRPKLAPWTARPDPGPDVTQGPKNPKSSVTFEFAARGIPCSTPSPYLVVENGSGRMRRYEAVDLRTFEKLGSAPVTGRIDREVASADGKYVMGYRTGQSGGRKVVWDVVSLGGKNVLPLEVPFGSPHLRDFLPGDKAITVDDQDFRVWDLTTGKVVKEYQTPSHPAKVSLTPGRKHVVALCPREHLWEVREAETGALLGQGSDPAVNEQTSVRDVCISPDGALMTVNLHPSGDEQLLVVDMKTGRKVKTVPIVKNISQVLGQSGTNHGRTLEWLPDGSGWLWHGQVWLDYETGAPVYTSAYHPRRGHERRLIGPNHLAAFGQVKGRANNNDALSVVALPKDEIAAAVAKARGGAAVAAKGLPPVKPLDESGARRLAAPKAGARWSYSPAAVAAAPTAELDIPLPIRPDEMHDIVFSDAAAGRAVVLHSFPVNAVSPQHQLRAERIDLKTGKVIDHTDLHVSDEFRRIHTGTADPVPPVGGAGKARAALSPDGTRLALRLASSPGRIDVWDLGAKKHVAGFKPGGERVEWFGLAGPDLLLAQDTRAGRLSAVRPSDGKLLYSIDGAGGPAALSPDRRHVAFGSAAGVAVADAASGEVRGLIDGPADALAFSPDGKALVLRAAKLTRVDLATGAKAGAVPVLPELAKWPLAALGPRHVCSGTMLYDFNLKETPVLHLGVMGLTAADSPDGRFWYAAPHFRRPGPDDKDVKGRLVARALPGPGLKDLTDAIDGGKVKPLLPPGTAIEITVKTGGGRHDAEYSKYATENLMRRGFKVGPGGLRLELTATEVALGGSIPYEVFVGNRKTGVSIRARVVDCEGTLKDLDGTVVAKIGHRSNPPKTIAGTDLEQAYLAEIWSGASAWMLSFQLPDDLYRVNGRVEKLPRDRLLGTAAD